MSLIDIQQIYQIRKTDEVRIVNLRFCDQEYLTIKSTFGIGDIGRHNDMDRLNYHVKVAANVAFVVRNELAS